MDRSKTMVEDKYRFICRGSREPCGSKYRLSNDRALQHPSRLARALWIEVSNAIGNSYSLIVEARESLVDRSFSDRFCFGLHFVEARESLVDRSNTVPTSVASRLCRGSREPCGSK